MQLYHVEVRRYLTGSSRWVAEGSSSSNRSPYLIMSNGQWVEVSPTVYVAVGRTKRQALRRLRRLPEQVIDIEAGSLI